MRRIYIFTAIIIVLSTIIFYIIDLESRSIIQLNDNIKDIYYREEKLYEDSLPVTKFEGIEQENKIPSEDLEDNSEESKNELNSRFHELLKTNEEIVGWVSIPNTIIDYPVVKTSNNDFYLNHNILKEESSAGAIFMDFRNDIEEMNGNIILYGHNMKNGTMFKGLMKYKNEDFFNKNRIISFSTLYEEVKWEIFSAYVTDTNFYYIQVNFKDNNEYESFLKILKDKSMFSTDTSLNSTDDILTLSTCSYEFNDARFVIHAKRIK